MTAPVHPRRSPQASELSLALKRCRTAFIGVAVMSGMINVLYLTGSFYMLEVYDRVLPSRSMPTLVALSVLAGTLYVAQGILDVIRSRILSRVGASLDESLAARVFQVVTRLPLKIGQRSEGLQPLRDLDSVRAFLSGLGPVALFDLPWVPLYVAICYLFHPLIGITATIGALVLTVITIITELMTRAPIKRAASEASARTGLADISRRNAEALIAMGMLGRLTALWEQANRRYIETQQRASDIVGGLGSVSKVLRMGLQSAVLGVGAYLVIEQQATAGIIIAGSILAARALAPVDLAIANWRGFVSAREGWKRLSQLLPVLGGTTDPMQLQPPVSRLSVEGASAVAPGTQKLLLQDISFTLQSGAGLGIIGPSGSGKSSLARLLVGVWPAVRGTIRLDGAAMDQWSPEALGRHIGYLPQDVELLAGSVAQNIARFEPDADAEAVIGAAKAAGVHDLILGLPEGYETQVGEQGSSLSAGQAQRIALARALYGDPFLLVLDEPNSNLDADGDEALTRAIEATRMRGKIVLVVAHRPSATAAVDQLLVLRNGRQQAFGPKDAILSKAAHSPPLKVVPDATRVNS